MPTLGSYYTIGSNGGTIGIPFTVIYFGKGNIAPIGSGYNLYLVIVIRVGTGTTHYHQPYIYTIKGISTKVIVYPCIIVSASAHYKGIITVGGTCTIGIVIGIEVIHLTGVISWTGKASRYRYAIHKVISSFTIIPCCRELYRRLGRTGGENRNHYLYLLIGDIGFTISVLYFSYFKSSCLANILGYSSFSISG